LEPDTLHLRGKPRDDGRRCDMKSSVRAPGGGVAAACRDFPRSPSHIRSRSTDRESWRAFCWVWLRKLRRAIALQPACQSSHMGHTKITCVRKSHSCRRDTNAATGDDEFAGSDML